MVIRVAFVFALGALTYVGYRGVTGSLWQVTVVVEEKEPPIAEKILLDTDLFYEDFGKSKVVVLRTFDEGETTLVEGISEPKPTVHEIVSRYGKPNRLEITNLSEHGIKQDVTVHYYGRLGLATPIGQKDGKVSWVIVR